MIMKKVKNVITGLIISLSIGLVYQSASAYTGYSGADTRLTWARQQAADAKRYLDSAGYATTTYIGSDFTKSSIQNVVPSVRVFYVSCHGSTTPSIITDAGAQSVTASELYSWTRGFYKFAFIDACHSGETSKFYNAFNMSDGDGEYHAFLGWDGYSYDNASYATFNAAVFEKLASGQTVNDSVWAARVRTGITNYHIYGNYSTTLYN